MASAVKSIDNDEEVKKAEEEEVPDMSIMDITDGANERGIPVAKFIDKIGEFSASFDPPASAELLIGAYTQLFNKYKSYESSLQNRQQRLKGKVPELEKSLNLVKTLIKKKQDGAKGVVRYGLADNIYAKAQVDFTEDKVNLWLGANVMLEYTYDEAHEFLQKKLTLASTELKETDADLGFVRDQIVTSEVNMSRIFNWDVRKKRFEEKGTKP